VLHVLVPVSAAVLKHLRHWTLQRIGDHIGGTITAVVSLLRRGHEDLRHQLVPEE
jgi:hypothetical protein